MPVDADPPQELDDGAPTEGAPAESAQPSAELAPPSADQIAAAAEVLVTVRTRRQLAAAITWNAMIAIAVILTVASIVLVVAGALGVGL